MYDGILQNAPSEYVRILTVISLLQTDISLWQIQYINYDGDVGDWNGLKMKKETISSEGTFFFSLLIFVDFPDHCSALIRVSDELKGIWNNRSL